ncbi:hypothetical protein SSX86_012238 [Deinandra increscens subsp. villosa]|uniref:Uncharacterized protein n=1 Tax=Deinandra increscens subsp. villosa TaxID=3103831 RepID=A0AAP0H1B9_9ASTR
MEAGSIVLMDLLWSDPTENDSVEGLRPNARGPGLVTFGPDRVEFCNNNDLQLIVCARECELNANRPPTPTRGRPQDANDHVS